MCSSVVLPSPTQTGAESWSTFRRNERDAGLTWSRRNPYTQRLRFLQTDRRLDYIFASAPARDGRGLIHSCRVVLDEGDADGVFPSDHFGVFAELQLLPL